MLKYGRVFSSAAPGIVLCNADPVCVWLLSLFYNYFISLKFAPEFSTITELYSRCIK